MDIKKRIRDRGMTIVEVAAKMGISQPALSKLITNGNPSYGKLCEIAEALGITVSELVADDETAETSLVCPHCGKAIHVKIEK